MPRRRRIDEIRTSFASDTGENEFRPSIDRFADDTSMLGFRYLHSRYKTWFRLTWAVVLCFFMGLTVYQVAERISFYFISNPLSTIRSFESPSQVNFPAFLICNKMQLKASKVAKHNSNLLRAMCYLHEEDGSFNSTEALGEFDYIDLREVYRESLQTVDDLFLSCEYEKGRSCMEDVQPMLTPHGLCFVVTPNMTVKRPGPETTLSLLLNLETYEVIPGTVSEPGVIVSLYDRDTPPSAHFEEGIHLDAGRAVSIPINDMRKLTRHEKACGRKSVGPFSEKEYTRAACQWVLFYNMIEEECGCTPIHSPANIPLLTPQDELIQGNLSLGMHGRPCTLDEETQCVGNITKDMSLRAFATEECPDDCFDVTYSSVVFGGTLIPSEVAALVRTDWEEDKEKRMNQFMPALGMIPNARIPIVRAVQSLSTEAQMFLSQSLKILSIESEDSTTPCVVAGGVRVLDRAMNHLQMHERVWKHLSTYIELVLSPHLKPVLDLFGLNVTFGFEVEKMNGDRTEITMRKVDMAIFHLNSLEASLKNENVLYGIKSIEPMERAIIVKRIRSMIADTLACTQRAKQDSEKMEEILAECEEVFSPTYSLLQSVRQIASILDPSISKPYEELASKLVQCLQKLKWKEKPKVFEWKNYDISLKAFETLYKEGGKDNQEIIELLKMRKLIHVDLIEATQKLADKLGQLVTLRWDFLEKMQMNTYSNSSEKQLESVRECLLELPPRLLVLRKSSFLRAEWISRVQRQVAIAQSYSAGTQYDEVNLLLVKVYFAHFKQETIVQVKSYNMFLLLGRRCPPCSLLSAEIGGTIGLYVGATLLTIAETIVFFFEKRTRNLIVKPNHV